MGDRALVLFTDGKNVSPTVYLHWNGSEVPALIKSCKELMTGRFGDVDYATARFIGLCHNIDPTSNLSLGVWNTKPATQRAVKKNDAVVLAEESHGDAGLVVVNVNDFTWTAYDGYLAEKETSTPQTLTT